MDFIDQIRAIASNIERQLNHIQTEEATKNALVLPFINCLGYNVFDPTEVVPEFTADVGTKKGEKVDYAIMQDGKPIMLFECKYAGVNLSQTHASQLFRYFTVTDARIGVLTNGIVYRFYTDLEKPNKMDERPFLEIDLQGLKEPLILELKKLSKASFDLSEMLSAAHDLKYTKALKTYLGSQLHHPGDEFIKFFTKQVYDGVVTQSVRQQFEDIIKRAFNQFINERINDRLKSALEDEHPLEEVADPAPDETQEPIVEDDGIVTTDEEMQGFHIVRAILRQRVEVSRIHQRDVKSYFGILLDNNNRKPLCRLHFNTSQKYLGLFDGESEERVPIESLDDIYTFTERLIKTLEKYEAS